MKTTTAGLLLKYLEAEGVQYIFGVPGTALVPVFDALNKEDAIKPILTKHEEGAAFMADGYARVSGKIGVCYASSGSGAIANIRDLGPMLAGLVGGPVIGLGAGAIGGIHRYFLSGFTAIPCALATVIAGLGGGNVIILEAKGIALGVMPNIEFEERDISLREGDIVVLYTDGVTEAINDKEEQFGQQRLIQLIEEGHNLPAQELIERIQREVTAFSGAQPQFDDVTLMILKVTQDEKQPIRA